MRVTPTAIAHVLLIEPRVFGDARGFFLESYNEQVFADVTGLQLHFVQDNHSRSQRHVLRGMHFQAERPQGKLVRVVAGAVFDVVVDIRRDSPTYSKWVGVELSVDNQRQLWIPPGLAHGFLVLSESADFLYKTTEYYNPASERCLAWNDPLVAIDWPLGASQPLVSDKDAKGLGLDQL
jgi:dTDP-4-dehydrorhamnose 3,5-epimerase